MRCRRCESGMRDIVSHRCIVLKLSRIEAEAVEGALAGAVEGEEPTSPVRSALHRLQQAQGMR